MNQQQIVNRINQLTLGNRLTWYDIMYDADKAIARINDYLGACYPNMSDILKSPEHTYSFYVDGEYKFIFPERYIHSIVIPFIAMEVLSRDEEFTTIYNKYATEVEDGLFSMFQNEFYKVPKNFRQDNTVGVFFGNDRPERRITDDMENKAVVFKFRVYYHINNEDIMAHIPIYVENDQVGYGESYTVQSYNPMYVSDSQTLYVVSHDGTHYYEFLGWRRTLEGISRDVNPGDTITNVDSDIHLYAQWNKCDTFIINPDGIISIDSSLPYTVSLLINTLSIPSFYNGYLVKCIASDFCGVNSAYLPNLKEIVMPGSIESIGERAFKQFTGWTIEFSYSREPVTIQPAAFNFANEECTLSELIIPLNVTTISLSKDDSIPMFKQNGNKQLTVYFRHLYSELPTGFDDVTSKQFADENVKKVWGYNG